jgi:hypothetical protein
LASSREVSTARFLDSLYKRYADFGIQVVAIIENDGKHYEENLSFPVISYKNDFKPKIKNIESLLKSKNYGIMIVDPFDVIKFSSSFYRTDDIRQLAEKFAIGHISYPPFKAEKILKRGDTFPLMSVKNLKENKLIYFPYGKENIAIFLTGRCPDCVFKSFRSTYSLIEEKLINSGKDIVLVFSPKFLKEDIMHKYGDLSSDLLLAIDGIPGIEDSFNSVYFFQNEIIVAEIAENGVITNLNPLDEWIKIITFNTKIK